MSCHYVGMTNLRRSLVLFPAVAAMALLAACAPTNSGGSSGGSGGGDGGSSGGGTAAGDCSVFDGTEAEPFTSSAVTDAPKSGTVWGDNVASFSFTVTPEVASLVPQLRFLTVNNGALQDGPSAVLIDQGAGVFSTESSLFDSNLDGQPGIAELFAISEAKIDGAKNSGQTLILGDYCVTYKLAP